MTLRRSLALLLTTLLAACAGAETTAENTDTEDDALKVCPGSSTVEGVDVSVWQGDIDWKKVRASGRAFAVIRVSDGAYHFDSKFDQNWSGAKAAGLARGVYQFFRASQDGTAQADMLLEHVGSDVGEIDPVADVEVSDGVSAATMNTHLAQWMTRIEQATGRTPIIYTSPGLWGSLSGSSQFAAEGLWVANWGVSCPSVPSPWSTWKFWQYSNKGTVPGISGAVDLDRFNGTLAQLTGGGASPPPPPPVQGPPTGKPAPATACGGLAPGQGLVAGESLSSCDGRFSLSMQTDGNLVLYRNGAGAVWSSHTYGSDGYAAILQGDGNFVLYGAHSNPLWASVTSGHAGATLALQADGNLVVYGPGGKALWASNTVFPVPPAAPSGCGTMAGGQGLTAGQSLSSCSGVYTLAMQADGNLVLYHNGKGATWSTGTNGKGGFNAVMQGDGNFVLYDTADKPLWNSHTNGFGGSSLAIQDDGNVVVYAPGGKAVWASGTNGK
jgi:lysozyme